MSLKDTPFLLRRAWRVWRRDGARHLLHRATWHLRWRNLGRAFDERGPWVTGFTIKGIQYGGSYDAAQDLRLALFLEEVSVGGKRLLELGPLEGGHTLALARAGGSEIVAVEGRPDNLGRCLLIKDVFDLKNATFLLGDIRDVTRPSHGEFDLVIAMGVLYHLPDPDRLLAHLVDIAPLTLLWTHVADERHPANAKEGTLVSPWGMFRGKVYIEDTAHPLSAVDREAIWLYRQDLVSLVKAVGFGGCKILAEWPAGSSPGPSVLAVLSV
jgi:SAM-dependent methyltransferase